MRFQWERTVKHYAEAVLERRESRAFSCTINTGASRRTHDKKYCLRGSEKFKMYTTGMIPGYPRAPPYFILDSILLCVSSVFIKSGFRSIFCLFSFYGQQAFIIFSVY